MTTPPPVYVPALVGPDALSELDRAPWDQLAHAYGTGRIHPDLDFDVAAALRRLGDDDPDAIAEACTSLFGNICHQGTIYQATAHAFPFLAAFGAGVDLDPEQSMELGALLASIGIASASVAPHGSYAGSWGPGVAPLTRAAIAASRDHLDALARRNPQLWALTASLLALVRTDPPDAAAVARLAAARDALGCD